MEEEKVKATSTFEDLKNDLDANSGKDVFNVIETHLKTADSKSWDNNKWSFIFDVLQSKFKSFTEDPASSIENLQRVVDFIQNVLIVFKFPTFQTHCMALIFVLRVVIFILNSKQRNSSFENNKLQLLLKGFLSSLSHLKSFEMNSSQMIEYFGKVMKYFCIIFSTKNSSINIKTTLEAWKTVSGLLKLYANQTRKPGSQIMEQYIEIMKEPLLILLRSVDQTFDLMYKTEALQQSPEQIEKLLRVKGFYTKILRQLLSEIQSECIPINEFFTTYIKAKFPPKHLEGSYIKELLELYIQTEINELFSNAYRNHELPELILSYALQNNSTRSVDLIESYFKTIINHKDKEFVNKNFKWFSKIFEEIFKDFEIRPTATYEQIIDLYVALILLSGKTEFLRYFRENVLKQNFWIASASVDVLITIQSYQCHYLEYPEAYLLQEFCFWRECNDSFALFSTDVRRTNVSLLLRNCFQLCKAKNSAFITNILGYSNSNNNIDPDNYKFLMAIGLAECFKSEQTLLAVHKKIIEELFQLISCLTEGNCTVNKYYKVVVYLNLLETSSLFPRREFMDCLVNAISYVLDTVKSSQKEFSLFISAVYSLIGKFVGKFETILLQKLLNCLKGNVVLVTLPGCIRFLSACSRSSLYQVQQPAVAIIKVKGIENSLDISLKLELDVLKSLKFDTEGCVNCVGERGNGEEHLSKRQCFEFKK